MKENIEEDIKILENFTEQTVLYGSTVGMTLEKYIDLQLSIKHILSDYKRVLKENERYQESDYETICLENNELSEFVDRIQSEYNDLINELLKLPECKLYGLKKCKKNALLIIKDEFIPVQKVKAKIEELNIAISECEYLDDDDERYKKAVEKDKLCLLNQKRILKQLLESEE